MTLLFVLTCINDLADPSDATHAWPALQRVWLNVVFVPVTIATIAWQFADKRRIRERFPQIPRRGFIKGLLMRLALLFANLVLYAVVCAVAQ